MNLDNWWIFIILVWLLISMTLLLVSFIVALINNFKLAKHIKSKDYQLWLNDRQERTVGIPIFLHIFNPFSLPDKYRLNNDEIFIKLRNDAQISLRRFFLCFAFFIVLLICTIGVFILHAKL